MQYNIAYWWLSTLSGFMVFMAVCFSSISVAEEVAQKDALMLSVFEYPPFLMEKSEDFGIEPAIVKLAFKRMGVEVSFVFVPPARAIEMAKLGQVDGTLGWVHSDERESLFYFSDTIAQAPLVFFHLKQKAFTWEHYDELQGKIIGTVNKFYYGPDFHQAQQKGLFQMDSVSDDELNLKKLIAGRIDLTPINLYVGYHLARQLFDTDVAGVITHNDRQLKISEHHVLLPKLLQQSSLRLSLFNQGLQAIKQSGEYQRILEHYSPETKIDQETSIDLPYSQIDSTIQGKLLATKPDLP